jgi:5-methylcytosine-specific restriction endonuclease McrA
MKSIEINGKRNVDKINKVPKPQRTVTTKWQVDDSFFIHSRQIELINHLYLEEDVNKKYHKDDMTQDTKVRIILKREINAKISGYKNQDIQKELFDKMKIISLEQTIERLMASKLRCYYCKEPCLLLYKDALSKRQWTLDRIDNDMGHNYDNVVVCCLECNVKRGDMDSDRFKRGKEIKFVRKLF